ncbi:unnamed protein product [Amaranthus hypochondriacus]
MAKEDEYSSSQPTMDLEYHLGSSDHPGIVITPVKLKGPNYDEWAKAVRRALIAKWKFGFVDGTITEPSMGSSKHKHWVAVNSMLVSWITNTLDDGLRSTIEDYDVVCDLWIHLKQSNANGGSLVQGNSTQGLVGITSDQVQQIIDLLTKPKQRLEGNASVMWIVDTGASNHVTHDILLMRNIQTIQNCPVGLPNGQAVIANQLGSVTLEGGLVLDNDHLTRTVIGVGERCSGLYLFRGEPQARVLAVDCVVDLWHQRMGHPADRVLKLLPPVSNFVRRHNFVCDICPRAKQCRNSFPISSNKADIMGDTGDASGNVGLTNDCPTDDEFDVWNTGGFEEVSEGLHEEIGSEVPIAVADQTVEPIVPPTQSNAASSLGHGVVFTGDTRAADVNSLPTDVQPVLPRVRGDVGNNKEVSSSVEDLGRGKRVKIPSTKLRDCVTHNIRKNKVSSPYSSMASLSSGTSYPITYFVNYDRFSEKHRNFIAAVTEMLWKQ